MDKGTQIAFLGIGAMGLPMADRVLAAGYPLSVWNRTPSRAEALSGSGARVAPTPQDVVRDAEVVITMLADPPAVLEIVTQIAPELRPGSFLIEMSTIGPDALHKVAGLLPEGVTLIDSPVMGSADRAAAGELVLLVGGAADPVQPLLEQFGTVVRTGGPGSGAALKIVLISAVVAGVVAIGEAMALADQFGLPQELVASAMTASPLAGIAGRAFAQHSSFAVRLAAKDIALAASVANLPLTRAVHERLMAFPGAQEQDLAHIVSCIRAELTAGSAQVDRSVGG